MKMIAFLTMCLMLGSVGLAQDAEELAKRAEGGDSRAQLALGRAYLNGTGLEKDCVQGMKWISKAAEQELVEAMRDLADYYLSGRCSDNQGWPAALAWYQKAASCGDGYSAYRCAEAFYYGAEKILSWQHTGFSVHSLVRAKTKVKAERVGKYMIRPLLSLGRLSFARRYDAGFPAWRPRARWDTDMAKAPARQRRWTS